MQQTHNKNRSLITSIVIVCLGFILHSQISYAALLPLDDEHYLPSIPKPGTTLGFEVGKWHARPDQIHQYFLNLAASTDRVKIINTGFTYEQRPLFLVFISSKENIKKLSGLRLQHLANTADAPLVTWLGFSVHGNEASGSNASMLAAYHFSAAEDADTKAIRNDQIIIIDPMLNPDGLARFTNWANRYKSKIPNPDPNNIEHNESWPNGRTNHYWFDLNRDWLPAQHPESRARLTMFHRWRPNILTDHHEMGTNSTFFFQPGVKNRTNPLTPSSNYRLTEKVAEFHANALDDIGSLYFSKEGFDDFYYGKGSTYPDVHGAVGILFEQASARGHVQDSIHGEVTFPFAIRNHLTTALSTVKAVQNLRSEFRTLRQEFDTDTASLIQKDKQKSIIFASKDKYRLDELLRILSIHEIKASPIMGSYKLSGTTYTNDQSYIVRLDQPQYRLIKSLFEHRTKFTSNVFYDVSAWNIADAFDIEFKFLNANQTASIEVMVATQVHRASSADTDNFSLHKETIALAFNWENFATAHLLSTILSKNIDVLGTTKKSVFASHTGAQNLPLGSIIVPLKNNILDENILAKWLIDQAIKFNVTPIQITSGLAIKGSDLGSHTKPALKPIRPLLIIGSGIRTYDAGEVWHLLDQRLDQQITMITSEQLSGINKLNQYTHLILVDGNYSFDTKAESKIKTWINQGGIVIAHSRGAAWITSRGWTSSKIVSSASNLEQKVLLTYADKQNIDAKSIIGGAITLSKIDISHPLGFGLSDTILPISKRSSRVFSKVKEAFVTVARFTPSPHIAGYMSLENRQHIANNPTIIAQGMGRGKLILFSDNPLFRGFWLGTSRVFVNALYYGAYIDAPQKLQPKIAHK